MKKGVDLNIVASSHKDTIFFSWSKIAVQCGVTFCCTNCESIVCTYIPSVLSLPPVPRLTPLNHHRALSPLSLCCTAASWSCLFHTWWYIHISMLLSQLVPPSPSRTVSTSPFSRAASLFLPCKQVRNMILKVKWFKRA